jgi:hypothetical protein
MYLYEWDAQLEGGITNASNVLVLATRITVPHGYYMACAPDKSEVSLLCHKFYYAKRLFIKTWLHLITEYICIDQIFFREVCC